MVSRFFLLIACFKSYVLENQRYYLFIYIFLPILFIHIYIYKLKSITRKDATTIRNFLSY